jgi:hypothetical protein
MAAGLAAGNIVEIDNLLTAYLPTNALRTITTFTATAGQSAFSVSYTQGLIDVFYNGSCLAQSEYLAINGTSITLVTACQVNDIVVVYAYSYSVGAYSGIGGSGTANYVSKFSSSSAITNSLIYDNGTNVGIGTTSAGLNLSVQGLYGLPATSGVQTVGIFRVQDSSSNIALDMGVVQNVATWIQSGNKANSAVLPLILNPSGGNVGIGNSSPDALLRIDSNVASTSNNMLYLYNSDYTATTRTFIRVRNNITVGSTYSSYFGQGVDKNTYIIANDTSRNDIVINGDNGNVGIGTAPISVRLDVKNAETGSVNPIAAFRDSSASGNAFQIQVGNGEARLRAVYYSAVTAMNMTFYTTNSAGAEAERLRITSIGSLQYGVAYSSGYHMDTTPSQIAVANGGTINFANFSGMVVMNNHSSGGVTIYLVGAGLTTAVASNGTQVGTMAYNGAISGYTWTNNSGGTNIFGAAIIRTRTTA